jgi:hypothetical protein
MRLVATLVAAAVALLPALARPAAADVGPETGSGGSNTGGRYGAWAWYLAVGGGEGATATSDRCDLPNAPGEEAHWEYFVSHWQGKTYVSLVCVGVLLRAAHPEPIPVLEGWEQDFLFRLWTEEVTPVPLDDLVARAVAMLDVDPPDIETDLRPGVDGLVNLAVHFRLTGDVDVPQGVAAQNGPVEVLVSAEPDPAVPVVWHTGDGRPPCTPEDGPDVCTHEYERSSNGQHHEDLPRDHYRVSADITYRGRYDVLVNGGRIDSADIGNIERAVELPLAVDEAQAINTRG